MLPSSLYADGCLRKVTDSSAWSVTVDVSFPRGILPPGRTMTATDMVAIDEEYKHLRQTQSCHQQAR